MPKEETFIKFMKEMDIRKSDRIIIYDRFPMFSSQRCFLTFKFFGHENVSILNGKNGHCKYIKYQLGFICLF